MSSSDLAFEVSTLLIGTSQVQTEWTSASFTPQNESEAIIVHLLLKPMEQFMAAPIFRERSHAIRKKPVEGHAGGVMRAQLMRRAVLDLEINAWVKARYFAIIKYLGFPRMSPEQEDALLGFRDWVTGEYFHGFIEAYIAAYVDPETLEKRIVKNRSGATRLDIDPTVDLFESLHWLLKEDKRDRRYDELRRRFRQYLNRNLGWVGPVVCNA